MRSRLLACRLASLWILVGIGGCAFRVGDLSLVSSQNVGLQPQVVRRSIEGKDCIYTLLVIPIGGLVPNLEEAMDRALAKVPEGNVMTDVAIYNDVVFTFIFNQQCLRVKGDVGKLQ